MATQSGALIRPSRLHWVQRCFQASAEEIDQQNIYPARGASVALAGYARAGENQCQAHAQRDAAAANVCSAGKPAP